MTEKFKKLIKLPAYIIMPAIFAVLGYLILYYGLKPVWNITYAAGSMLMAESAPVFVPELTDVYDPNAVKPPKTVSGDGAVTTPDPNGDPSATPVPEEPYIAITDVDMPEVGARYGHISCSRIGLDAPVYWGNSNVILRYGVAQFIGSFLPGFNRVILLSAHNTTFFKCLKNANVGDVIEFDTNYETYKYRVYSIEVKEATELEDELNATYFLQEKETLIMYTCWPFHAIVGRKTQRLILYCERIEGASVRWRV